MEGHAIIGFNHRVLRLAENPALRPGFFRQNTSGYALGVLTPKASPSGWVFSQAQHPMIKTYSKPWWRHHMETFSALLALCVGNSPVTGEFPSQRPERQSFDGFFYLRLNKRLSKKSWDCWFETPSRSLWHHSNTQYSVLHRLRRQNLEHKLQN